MTDLVVKDAQTESDAKLALGKLADRLLSIPFSPYVPNKGPQSKFLLDFDLEALYGGSAGSGKSFAVLMAASQFLDIPGYAALILRKSYSQLTKPGALMDLAFDWWGGQKDCRFVAAEKKWVFTCRDSKGRAIGRSTVTFGYLERENDRTNYQGGQYSTVIYDELTQFKERDYTYLFSRLRRIKDPNNPLSKVPIRMRATANPGGIGHAWVHQRFIAPYEAWRDGRGPRPRGKHGWRNFHPALIKDNPKLDAEEYEKTLDELSAVERAQLMRGDWNIRPEGRMFKRVWFKPIDYKDVPGNCSWVRFWDMASTEEDPSNDPDFTVGMLVGRAPDGRHYIMDMRRWRVDAGENESRVCLTALCDGRQVQIGMEQEGGASGKAMIYNYRVRVLRGYDFRGIPSTGSKVTRAGPVASQAEAGMVHIVTGEWNADFLSEIEIFPDKGNHDDAADSLSGAFEILAYRHSLGIRFDDNDEFVSPSQWKPDRTNLSTNDLTDHGMKNARAVEAELDREADQRRMEREMEGMWDV